MIKIIEFLKLLFLKNKTITIALIVSLLVHIFLLSKFLFSLPELDEGRQAINVRLVNVQAMQKATSTPAIKAYKEPIVATPEPPQPEPEASSVSAISTNAGKPKPLPDTPAEISAAQENIQPTEQAVDEKATNPSPLEIVVTEATNETSEMSESTETANIVKKPVPQAYNQVETEFEVRRGNDASTAGIARIVFTLDKNRTYVLTSMTKAQDLTSLSFDTHTQKSEGVVTDKGLIPSFYAYQYGNDPNNSQSARFAWSNGKLQMHSAKSDITEDLSPGTQDFLSFMYQFMFSPPLENMEITMTNGKKLRTYHYNFQGEEKISTKLGELNTIHLLKSGNEEDKTELWLGIDYQYLPVKIRKIEKDGSFIEQTATSIYTN